jgi:hypothetical protein
MDKTEVTIKFSLDAEEALSLDQEVTYGPDTAVRGVISELSGTTEEEPWVQATALFSGADGHKLRLGGTVTANGASGKIAVLAKTCDGNHEE